MQPGRRKARAAPVVIRCPLLSREQSISVRGATGSNRCIPVNQLDTRKKALEAALKLALLE